MKRSWLNYVAGGFLILLLTVAVGCVSLYWYLEPSRYFSRTPHPVLSESPIERYKLQAIQQHTEEPKPLAEEITTTSKASEPSFNVLILGIDKIEGGIARTDVILLAHVDPLTRKVLVLSIPRDTKVKMEGIGYTKINHAHVLGSLRGGNQAGTMAAIQSVTELLDVPVNYYVKVSMNGFERFIDEIGGIDVQLAQPIGDFPAGFNHLTGAQALDAARERVSLAHGDLENQQNQALILKSIATKVLQLENIPKIPDLYQQVKQDLMDTNFTDADILSLSLLFQGITEDAIHYVLLPGKGGSGMDPFVKARLYYWEPDPSALQTIAQTFSIN